MSCRRRGIDWEFGIDMYALFYLKILLHEKKNFKEAIKPEKDMEKP